MACRQVAFMYMAHGRGNGHLLLTIVHPLLKAVFGVTSCCTLFTVGIMGQDSEQVCCAFSSIY